MAVDGVSVIGAASQVLVLVMSSEVVTVTNQINPTDRVSWCFLSMIKLLVNILF